MYLFHKAKPKSNPKEAIVKLRESLSMLEKRQSFLEGKVEAELKIAKINATKNRKVALLALKRKKQYEDQIEKISGARLTLETQAMAIENANVNFETMNAMRAGAEAIRDIHNNMDINHVDETMDEIRDQMDLANEISDAISRPVGFGDELDEDDLLDELESLEQQELDASILQAPTPAIYAPSVPFHEPTVSNSPIEDDEEKELAALQASMAM